MSWILSSVLGTLFLLGGCLAQSRYECFCLVSLYPVLSCLVVDFWRPALFGREAEGSGSCGRGTWEKAGSSGGRGTCGKDVFYDRKVDFQLRKEKENLKLEEMKQPEAVGRNVGQIWKCAFTAK